MNVYVFVLQLHVLINNGPK